MNSRLLLWRAGVAFAVASMAACSESSPSAHEVTTPDASSGGAAGSEAGPDSSVGGSSDADAAVPDAVLEASPDVLDSSAESAPDGSEAGPSLPPSKLPLDYQRADVGQPITQQELQAVTDEVIALLHDTRYFGYVDDRIHGWPQTDPEGRYWYGTWWSGVQVIKAGGKVTYLHSADGADNNGLRTAPYMESACYAHLLWHDPATAHLARRIVRGFSSWAIAMVRHANDGAPTMLTRASYPVPVQSAEGGRDLYIDYSLNRPGIDNGATSYVHLPDNPTWGDLWVKNKRSKDDLGHMYRAMAQVHACQDLFSAEQKQDLDVMRELYASWSRRVEDDLWSIATWDKDLNYWIPPIDETLAHFYDFQNIECTGMLMLRLLGHSDTGAFQCGSGISDAEKLAGTSLKNSNKQMMRTYHEGAVNMALYRGSNDVALQLLQGLAQRVESDLAAVTSPNPPQNVNDKDVASMLLHAANAGVPLTSLEVRWLHERIHQAYASYRDPSLASAWNVFDVSVPDGTYPYQVEGAGLFVSDLGVLLGSCASMYRNPKSRPLLDCDRLLSAAP